MKSKVMQILSMASVNEDSDGNLSNSDSDISDTASDSAGYSDQEPVISKPAHHQGEACRYYNSGFCRDGKNCRFLHFCKYALRGGCRNGANCQLKHPAGARVSSGGSNKADSRATSGEATKLTDGRFYQWQLNNGKGWKDIINDHIIEAQFSLPYIRSIKIYNTPYGVVSIDFKQMRVYGKSLKVRRLDDCKTTWLWYCSFHHKWVQYDGKDSKGNPIPAKSSNIEQKFQNNPLGSFTFINGPDNFDIQFKEMQQVGAKKKRKVARRPKYRQPQAGAAAASLAVPLTSQFIFPQAQTAQWQFRGNSGKWHVFKKNQQCSVSSDDIERQYQQNPSGSMNFTVSRQTYMLDFGAMTQKNLSTTRMREVRRVLS